MHWILYIQSMLVVWKREDGLWKWHVDNRTPEKTNPIRVQAQYISAAVDAKHHRTLGYSSISDW